MADLGIIAHPPQQPVCNSGCPAASFGDFLRTFGLSSLQELPEVDLSIPEAPQPPEQQEMQL